MSEENTLSNGAETPEVVETQQTAVDAEGLETTETGSESSTEEKKPARGVQKRLDELTREKYEERRRADRLEQILAQNQSMMERIMGTQQAPQKDENAPPSPQDYVQGSLDPQYIADLTDFKVKQALEGMTAKQRAEAARKDQEAQLDSLRKKEVAFMAKTPDYAEVRDALMSNELIANHPGIGEAVISSEIPTELMYYLGKHPDEAEAIAKMTPYRAAAALGRIEERLSAPRAAERRVSNAPAPINPITGGGSVIPTSLDEAQDMETYARLRKAGKT